jgi:hypothetical protein
LGDHSGAALERVRPAPAVGEDIDKAYRIDARFSSRLRGCLRLCFDLKHFFR